MRCHPPQRCAPNDVAESYRDTRPDPITPERFGSGIGYGLLAFSLSMVATLNYTGAPLSVRTTRNGRPGRRSASRASGWAPDRRRPPGPLEARADHGRTGAAPTILR